MTLDIIIKEGVHHARLNGEEDMDYALSTKQEGYDIAYYHFQQGSVDAECGLAYCKQVSQLDLPNGDPLAVAIIDLFEMRLIAEETGLTQVYVRHERATNFYITGKNFLILTAIPAKSFGVQAVKMLRACDLICEEEGRRIRRRISELDFKDRDVHDLIIVELIER